MIEKAKGILGNVHPDFNFKIKNGGEFKNLRELVKALDGMDDKIFQHHVNNKSNDFSNWIKDILKDEDLAEELSYCHDRLHMMEVVKNRMVALHSLINKPADMKSFEELIPEEDKENNKEYIKEAKNIEEVKTIYGIKLTKEISHKIYYISWGVLIGLIIGIITGYLLG